MEIPWLELFWRIEIERSRSSPATTEVRRSDYRKNCAELRNEFKALLGAELPVVRFRHEHHKDTFHMGAGMQMAH